MMTDTYTDTVAAGHTGAATDQRSSVRELWHTYKRELLFLAILSLCVVAGHWVSAFIPVDFMETVLTPIQHGANTAICLAGACLLFAHSDGMRVRKLFAWTMLVWGVSEIVFMLQHFVWQIPVFHFGNGALTSFMMLAGNFLGWLLLLYPVEALRPRWLNLKRAILLLLPMVVLAILDYLVPADLRWLSALYPGLLFVFMFTMLRAYRTWCEENYSSMDNIDVQWIVRYLMMLLHIAVSYAYMMVSDSPTRAFAQNALLVFVFAYSTEQILFRKDPWEQMLHGCAQSEDTAAAKSSSDEETPDTQASVRNAARRKKLERWMTKEKPYLNPDFQLMDLRQVIPTNRTYLSQFVRDEYGCTFCRFVNGYRLEESKRLLREHPELTVEQVAARSGFSSRVVFTRTFTQETGMSPREWSEKCNNT